MAVSFVRVLRRKRANVRPSFAASGTVKPMTFARRKRPVGADRLGEAPDTVLIEVDPGGKQPGAQCSHGELHRLADGESRCREHHAVLVVRPRRREVVAERIRIHQCFGFGIDAAAEHGAVGK